MPSSTDKTESLSDVLSWLTECTRSLMGNDCHRRQDASPQLRHGHWQSGHPHGECMGYGNISAWTNDCRCEEQRDHRDPKLLEIIEISGGLITIDAMGCQTEIAAKSSMEVLITVWPSKAISQHFTRQSKHFSCSILKTTLQRSMWKSITRRSLVMDVLTNEATTSAKCLRILLTRTVGRTWQR